jgi:hypothetical protein
LGLQYSGDGGEYQVDSISGEPENFFKGNHFNYAGGIDPHYSIDRMVPLPGTEVLFHSEDQAGRIFSFENDVYRAISSTLVFGALQNNDSLNIKPYLISEYINYLLNIQTITSLEENLTSHFTGAYPNPFSSQIVINYELNQRSHIHIDILDLNGRLIKSLLSAEQPAGSHSVIWDGCMESGLPAENGFYFYSLTENNHSENGKMILIR